MITYWRELTGNKLLTKIRLIMFGGFEKLHCYNNDEIPWVLLKLNNMQANLNAGNYLWFTGCNH